MAAEGKFRSDLLDRLAFDVLTLPPLREREEDILLLANHFAVDMAKELGREFFPGFSIEVAATLEAHDWPGNVRELKNVVERCVYRTEPEDEVTEVVFDPFASPYRPLNENGTAEQNGARTGPKLPLELKDHIRDYEIELIEKAMDQSKHNQRKAAELLGLTYHQLRGYLKKYELVGAAAEEE